MSPRRVPIILRFETFETPFGPFSVAVDAAGAVVATSFGGKARLNAKLPNATWINDPAATVGARRQLEEYFRGNRREFSLPVAAAGTDFQHRVWSELCKIPHGRTTSYGEIAAALGNPGASRAVGRANATNPVCVIVPCHRVIGAEGSLTG